MITGLSAEQELELDDQPDNPHNDRAIRLLSGGRQVGWIPDWLVDDVHRLREEGSVRVYVEQVNPDAPPYLALLCRLEASAG